MGRDLEALHREVRFHDCQEVVLLGPGGSNDAEFVQILQDRSDNVARLRDLAPAFEPMMSTYRPELLGSTIGLRGDGGFTKAAYSFVVIASSMRGATSVVHSLDLLALRATCSLRRS